MLQCTSLLSYDHTVQYNSAEALCVCIVRKVCVCVCIRVCLLKMDTERKAAVGEWVVGGGAALQTNCRQKSNFIYYWRRCQGEQFAGLPVPGSRAWARAESAAMPSTPTSSHLYSHHTLSDAFPLSVFHAHSFSVSLTYCSSVFLTLQ